MITTRPATPEDLPYILDTFARSYRQAPCAEGLGHRQVRELLVRYLLDPAWATTILADDEVPDEILAFVVWKTPSTIAWIQTKGPYKRRGLATKLLTTIGAHRGRAIRTPFVPSPAACRALRSKGWPLLHRPWIA